MRTTALAQPAPEIKQAASGVARPSNLFPPLPTAGPQDHETAASASANGHEEVRSVVIPFPGKMAAPPAKPQPDHSRAKNAKHSREKAQGFVYFIQSIHGGPVKIGWAKNPKARLPELQCGSPVKLIIAGTAQLKRETGLVANGGLLQGLRNRGLVRSRVEEVWQDFNQHSTTYWATWLVAAREPKAAIA